LLALSLRQQGGRSALVIDAFEKSLAAAKTAYYDDALFALAQTYENGGRRVRRDGRWEEEPDYVKALALYQRLTKEFKKSESRYWDQAQESARNITEPQLNVSVGQMFLPGGRPSFYLSWRNVADVKFRLEKVDPLTDFAPQPGDSASNWTEGFRKGGKKVRQWEKALVAPEHAPGNETINFEEPLPAGTYLLTAESGKLKSTEIVLMTDALVLTRSYPAEDGTFDAPYLIDYLSQTQAFNIMIYEEPIGEVRQQAEQYLEQQLGISQTDMCRLNYTVIAPNSVNQIYGGQNLGFSFCPGATQL
jgi:tetratricopeptide (TPR) repeat protein